MVQEMNTKAIKYLVIFFAAVGYIVGVGYAEIMFIQIMQRAFPSGIAGGFAMVGAIVAGISALVLPVALHWWFAPGLQFAVGVIFYLVDLTVLGANAMLAYQLSTGHIDGLLATWYQFCPAAPIICVAGWALMFAFDPSHKLRHAQIAIRTIQINRVAQGMEQGMNTREAHEYLTQVGVQAMWMAASQLQGQALPHLPQLPAPTTATPNMLPQAAQPLQLSAAQPKQGFIAGVKRLFKGDDAQAQLYAQLAALQQQMQQQQNGTSVPTEVTGKLVAMPSPLAEPASFHQNGHVTPEKPNQAQQ